MPHDVERATSSRKRRGRDLRADARRNVEAILDAGVLCLARDPDASVADIAQAAGVGRVTLYGHFKSRAELVDAVFALLLERAHTVLSTADISGDPHDALVRLVASSWQIVDQFRSVLRAAQSELSAERIRRRHDMALGPLRALIDRGQRCGAFRTDLPAEWLLTTSYGVMHAAAEDCTAGRMNPRDAPQIIAATVLAAFTPPGEPVPAPVVGASG